MSAQIARLSSIRPQARVTIPPGFERVSEIFGIPAPGEWSHFELWGKGARSYVMLTAGRLRINISHGHVRFANRAEARRWASAFLAGHRLEHLPERSKKDRP